MNLKNFILNIEGLIASGRVQDAIHELSWFIQQQGYQGQFQNQIVLLSAKFNQLQKEKRLGYLSLAEENMASNQLNFALLDLLEQLKDLPTNSSSTKHTISNSKNVLLGDITNVSNVHIGDSYEPNPTSKEPTVQLPNNQQANAQTIKNLLLQQNKIRILFLTANPSNEAELQLNVEVREIEEEIKRSKHRDRFELIKIAAVRVMDLRRTLLEYEPHFVHFSGHGTQKGIALMGQHPNESHTVPSKPLADLFKLFSNTIACVFLNACFSEHQGQQIRRFIPNVIGMQSTIHDQTAIVFAASFYSAIGAGREIRFAFELAKSSIGMNALGGSHVPVYLD